MSRERAKSYLDNPFRKDQRWVLVCRSGKDVDKPARVLSRICGTIDVALAKRLHRIRQGDRFLRLGYARFVDYARERLDMPARTAQEVARLGAALERLPALDRALSSGRLSWTSALLVARMANREEVDEWIALARSVSVRQLAAGIAWVNRRDSEGGPDGGDPSAVAGGCAGRGESGADPTHSTVGAAGLEDRSGERPGRPVEAGGMTETAALPEGCAMNGAQACAGAGSALERDAGPPGEDTDAKRLESAAASTAAKDAGNAAMAAARLAAEVEEAGGAGRRLSDEDDTAETPTTWRLRTPAVAKRNWEAALELCSLVAQSDLWGPEATELMLAEFLSGTDGPAVDEEWEDRVERAARDDARRATERHAGRRRRVPAEPIQDFPPDWKPAALSRATRAVLKKLSEPVEDGPFALDASLRKLLGGRRSVELDLAGLLSAFRSLGGWRDLDYETFSEYVQERLGMSSRRARFLATLDRGLAALPAVDAAARSGAIGLVAASLVCRVASTSTVEAWLERARAIPVARLRREVDWALRRGERGAAVPPALPSIGELPSALDEVTAEVLARAGAAELGRNAAGSVAAIEGGGVSAGGLGPTPAPNAGAESASGSGPTSALDAGAESASGSGPMSALDVGAVSASGSGPMSALDAGAESASGSGPMSALDAGAESASGSGPMSALDVGAVSAKGSGPMSALDGDAAAAWGSGSSSAQEAGAGSVRESELTSGSPRGSLSVGIDAPHAELRVRLTPHARVLWERSRRALEHARGDRVSDGDIVEAVANAFLLTWLPFWVEAVLLGDPIAVREKFRCIVPGCTVHGGSAHHIVYRGLGGSDDPSNLAFVCFSHHILGEHADRLRISGTAPDRLRVELGLRPDGAALETFVGGVRCGELPREQLGALPGAAPAAGA